MISIVIPCFNHGEYLQEAISSIAIEHKQISVEVIITDDGSTQEETKKNLKFIEDKYAYTIVRQQNQGLGAARNNAIKSSKGKYILPLDADNKLNMAVIEKCLAILEEKPDIDVVYTDCIYFGDREGNHSVGKYDLLNLIGQNYIDACALYRKDAWERCGGYDKNMPVMGHEDWELWLHMSFTGSKFFYLPEVGFYYRVNSNSMLRSVTSLNEEKNIAYIVRKHQHHIAKYYHLLFKRYTDYRWVFDDYMKNNKSKAIMKTLLNKWNFDA